jgi:hypothetical protein
MSPIKIFLEDRRVNFAMDNNLNYIFQPWKYVYKILQKFSPSEGYELTVLRTPSQRYPVESKYSSELTANRYVMMKPRL